MKTVSIIGTGRVGLPLALFFETLGYNVKGIDVDESIIKILQTKQMPFHEPGCQELLNKSDIVFTSDINAVGDSDYIFITVGTPLMQHIETDLSNIDAVIQEIAPVIKKGQCIVLRSTISPNTTKYVKTFIEEKMKLEVGTDVGLAFCPERLAENKALAELKSLPQVIGCEDELSFDLACKLFEPSGVKILKTNYLSAELTKLFNNISRYVDFALSNQLAMTASEYGQNIHEILRLANEDYPRGFIARPGLTAGTCLRKDFGMINENTPHVDLFLASWKVNENVPLYLVKEANKHKEIKGSKVAVLGYTFKKDSDDTRDTLVPKLMRYIHRQVPGELLLCEPNIDSEIVEGYKNYSLNEVLDNADIIFIAVNHTYFKMNQDIVNNIKDGAIIVDIWNSLGLNKVVYKKGVA